MRVVTPSDLELVVRAVEAGKLVIVPTSRWYMICCDAGDAEACAHVFAVKRRPIDKSLLLVARSMEAVRQCFRMSAEAETLAETFWPGELALLLPWRDPAEGAGYTAVGSEEALVCHTSGVLGELARRAACLLAATSANISGENARGPSISLTEVREFVAEAQADVPVVVDGGVCPTANHLTIVRCVTDHAELVRAGVLHPRAVTAALGREIRR